MTFDTSRLKPGDAFVTVEVGGASRGIYRRFRVKTVTPTGRIKTEDGYEFNADGDERGTDKNGFLAAWYRIVEETPEVSAWFVRRAMVKMLRNRLTRWEDLPDATLLRLVRATDPQQETP